MYKPSAFCGTGQPLGGGGQVSHQLEVGESSISWSWTGHQSPGGGAGQPSAGGGWCIGIFSPLSILGLIMFCHSYIFKFVLENQCSKLFNNYTF